MAKGLTYRERLAEAVSAAGIRGRGIEYEKPEIHQGARPGHVVRMSNVQLEYEGGRNEARIILCPFRSEGRVYDLVSFGYRATGRFARILRLLRSEGYKVPSDAIHGDSEAPPACICISKKILTPADLTRAVQDASDLDTILSGERE